MPPLDAPPSTVSSTRWGHSAPANMGLWSVVIKAISLFVHSRPYPPSLYLCPLTERVTWLIHLFLSCHCMVFFPFFSISLEIMNPSPKGFQHSPLSGPGCLTHVTRRACSLSDDLSVKSLGVPMSPNNLTLFPTFIEVLVFGLSAKQFSSMRRLQYTLAPCFLVHLETRFKQFSHRRVLNTIIFNIIWDTPCYNFFLTWKQLH